MTKLPPCTQLEIRNCAYCRRTFTPKREAQAFCNTKCRSNFHEDHGAEGVIAGVTRLTRGRVSVVVHFDAGPAAEHAIAFERGEIVRTVKQPRVTR
jgi:hypothetical protein